MSVAQHRAAAPPAVPCFVLTISDTRTLETETSGKAIAELLEQAGHIVADRQLVPDEPARIAHLVASEVRRGGVRAIITTGGTGISKRDSTYEALTALFEKTLTGFGELFRMLSFHDIGSAAMLSRATAGVAGGCAIFILPGSEAAVRLAMSRLIVPELGHIASELAKHESGSPTR
jgi:molybdenum cofactor biosynthesis protein B